MSATLLITPTKRRKRPSLSPRKPGKKSRLSEPTPDTNSRDIQTDNFHIDIDNATPPGTFSTALNFYDYGARCFTEITSGARKQLLAELRSWQPGILAITTSPPFLFVECEVVPHTSMCPFIIAGLVAKFLEENEPFPVGASFMGEPGRKEVDDLPAHIDDDLKRLRIPSRETFQFLFRLIPSAEHITSYPQQLLVELSRCSDDVYINMLNELPAQVGELNVGYINGSEWFDSYGSAKAPKPQLLDGEYDDSNYLAPENGGMLRPGIVLECKGIRDAAGAVHGAMLCNAGVGVIKGKERRFTTARHCWDAVGDKVVYHADRAVGRIEETLGDDIALVQSPFSFSNGVLDLNATAQTLKRADEFVEGDYFVLDSAFTGRQRLMLFGVRAGKHRAGPQWKGPKEEYDYVVLEQGVYSVETPIMESPPMIREGVCGTPIIHAGRKIGEEVEYVAQGVVGGFMLYCDNVIPTSPKAKMLYRFCQTTDELLDDGWEIYNE
jgi:hypothetical protein